MSRPLLYTLLILLLLPVLAGGWLWQRLHADKMVHEVVVEITHGASTGQIAHQLAQAGVIDDAWLFKLWVRLNGTASAMKAGQYRFNGLLSIGKVVEHIQQGDVLLYRLTVPEGLKTGEILAVLARHTGIELSEWQAALQKLIGDQDAEGLLLPETYTYSQPLQAGQLLQQMLTAQAKLLAGLAPEMVAHVRIMASIVEKETALDRERPLVAAVIRNRLHKHMPLQMDPTVIYGIWRRDHAFSGNLHKQDLRTDTPWNTYTRRGLPPTPICNPGKASLLAAMQPADVDYLYFVADGSGGHAFASTLGEHQANVQQWIKLERQRNHGS